MDYKKLYEKAVERAKTLTNSGFNDFDFVKHIFPELAESEDEKIRKGIIRNLEYLMDRAEGFVKDELKERIAWLEKQKPIQNINKEDEEVRQYLVRIMKQRDINVPMVQKSLNWLEKQGQTFTKKDVDNAYLKGVCDAKQEIEKQGKQKPAWSEEDSPYYDDICEMLINLLHSETADVNKGAVQKDLDWLMSLKPQSTWKPSDEQMVAVQEAMNIVGILTITGSKINSLYQDLKKLKE